VTFATNVTFNGCSILMDANATLQFAPGVKVVGATLNGVKTRFYGCNNMWESIVIGQSNIIQFFSCIVEDGKNGIAFRNGYNTTSSMLINCQFGQNINAITAINVPAFTFAVFSGNRFTADPLNTLTPFVNGSTAQVGILADNTTGTIGSGSSPNRFTELGIGIEIRNNSTIAVNNAVFANNTLQPQGFGIHATKSSLSIRGTFSQNGGNSCVFTQNNIDIFSALTNVFEVDNASFNDPISGSIEIAESFVPNLINIINSDFNIGSASLLPTNNLIEIERASQGGNVRHIIIEGNTITIHPALTTSPNDIDLLSMTSTLNPSITDRAEIDGNYVYCNYGNPADNTPTRTIDGFVFSGNADRYEILDNYFYYNSSNVPPNAPVTSIAISILDNIGIGNRIVNNYGRGVFHPNHFPQIARDFLRCGVHTVNTPTVFLCFNDMAEVTNNYHFIDDCSNIELGYNIMGTGEFGLVGDGSNSLPLNHHHRRNQWVGTYNGFSARHDVTNPPAGLDWDVDPNYDPLFMPPPQTFPFVWFDPEPQPSGITPCSAENLISDDPDTKKVAEDLVLGKYAFVNTSELWDFEYNILSQMIRFPSTIGAEGSVSLQYYSNRVGTTLWQLAKIQNDLDNAMKIEAAQQDLIDAYFSTASTLFDSIHQIDTTQTQDTLLLQQKETLLMDLHKNQAKLYELIKIINSNRIEKIELVINQLNLISTSSKLEESKKDLLLLIMKRLTGQSWSTEDRNMIHSWSHACKEELGRTVSIAQSLLPPTERNTFSLCGTDHPCSHNRSIDANNVPADLKINPNPTNDFCELQFAEPYTGVVNLFDLKGETLFTQKYFNKKSIVIPVINLSGGVYIVSYQTKDGIKTKKIVVYR
jgi:hypothetical protein